MPRKRSKHPKEDKSAQDDPSKKTTQSQQKTQRSEESSSGQAQQQGPSQQSRSDVSAVESLMASGLQIQEGKSQQKPSKKQLKEASQQQSRETSQPQSGAPQQHAGAEFQSQQRSQMQLPTQQHGTEQGQQKPPQPQQSGTWGQSQQRQQMPSQPQQPGARDQSQQIPKMQQPLQQRQQMPSQPQQPGARDQSQQRPQMQQPFQQRQQMPSQPQQPGSWGQPQQRPQMQQPFQQQQQMPPSHLPQQAAWTQSQQGQQMPPQLQQQGAWGQSQQRPQMQQPFQQQQMPPSHLPQQAAWTQSQQGQQMPPQLQQQGAWGQHQQRPQMQQPFQQQQQMPPSQPQQQQMPPSQPQQQAAWTQSQQGQQMPPQPQQSDGKSQQQQRPQKQPSQQKQRSKATISSPPPIKEQQTSQQVQQAASGDGKQKSFALSIPKRNNLRKTGSNGRSISLETNYLALSLNKKIDRAVQYDVDIQPDKPKKLFRKIMEEMRIKCYRDRYPPFDGNKIMFSASPLPFGNDISREVEVLEEERVRKYTVTVKFAAYVDLTVLTKYFENPSLNAQTAIQCLDVVIRSAPALRCIPVGRSFFVKPPKIIDLGEGMEMYYGFYQSAILGWKPFLNVDVAHKAFPKTMDVIELVNDLLRKKYNLNRFDLETLGKFIKNLKVRFEIPNNPASKRTYRVNGIDKPANEAKFKDDDDREWTVFEYFRQIKRYVLKNPDLPTVWVGPLKSTKKILMPIELCTVIEGQVTNRALTPAQTSAMIRQAATSTDVRKTKIYDSINQAKYNIDPCIKEFGISVEQTFYKVQGRILNPPNLQYKTVVTPSKGTWFPNEFLVGAQIKSWGILCLDYRTKLDKLKDLARMLKDESRRLGMNLPPDSFIEFLNLPRDSRKYKEEFMNGITKFRVHLVVVVIPEDKEIYSVVKQVSELSIGQLTQCVKGNTVYRASPPTVKNILLKINAKLDGVNHKLATRPRCLDRPCMIMGADVTHPSPESRNSEPSVAAVTASHDPTAFKYNICWRLQPATKEIIDDLTAIVKEHLLFFYKHNNNRKPEHIIFFRDGVSEGQFQQVLNEEINAIRKACSELESSGTYKPAITFLVVQKRHHTRFFPTSSKDIYDRKNNNVPAGTVVDTDITHPTDLDFYLVSHASIQGVARPTRYRKLWDDKNMSEDELEELTYYLCHLFSRCTRSVSYPAPTYYAHLAAARAKVYCGRDPINLDNLRIEQSKRIIKPEIVKELPMFFV